MSAARSETECEVGDALQLGEERDTQIGEAGGNGGLGRGVEGPDCCGPQGEPRTRQGKPDPAGRSNFVRGGARPSITEVSEFVAAHRHHGVVPICRVLSTEEHQIAPSSVRSALVRPTCARRLADDELKTTIAQIFTDNYEVCGARKIQVSLTPEHDVIVDRGRVTRLMSELEIRGAARSRSIRTTKPDKSAP